MNLTKKRKTKYEAGRVLLLLLLFCSTFAISAYSQSKTITGTVYDEKGETIIGANVLVKGKTTGTITNIDGKFSINVLPDDKIVVSYIGYNSQEIKVGAPNFYKVTMSQNSQNLEEVVVVGYGTVNKRSFTGSVSSVKSDDLTALKTMSPTQGLQGRATGVNVTTASGMLGAPTKINIRGINSINAGTSPLWIIDGVPIYSGGGLEASSSTVSQDPMSMINPNDIETMEVLKDAAATAIYGSRGSNGVIIITTKSGKKSAKKGNINVDYNTGFSDLTRTPSQVGFATTEQWIALADKAIQNQSGIASALFQPSQTLDPGKVPFSPLSREQALATNSNWYDQVVRTGQYHDVNMNMSKGFEGGSVYTSFNYRTDKGVLKNNDMDRITGRINGEFEAMKNFRVGTNIAFSYSHNNRVKTGYAGAIGGGGGSTGAFESANRNAMPWMPIYDETNPTGYWSARSGNLAANNDRRFLQDYVDQYRITGNTFAEFKVVAVKGLSARTEFGVDYLNNSSVDWRSDLLTEDKKSYAMDQNSTRRVINYNAYLKYNNTFGIHSFNSVLGTESMRMMGWTRKMESKGLKGTYPQLGELPGTLLSMSSRWSDEDYLRSYFFRTDYRLLDKYVLAVSYRLDGSAKFYGADKWGPFAALSGAWLISEEDFFSSMRNTINQLKLKASFGQTGNNSIGSNRFNTNYRNSSSLRYGDVTYTSSGTEVSNLGNRDLTWETTSNYDTGIDFGFLNNRISGSLEYYYKKISDMLLEVQLPISTGIGGNKIYGNIGDLANYGVDFTVTSTNIDKKNFKWTTTLNISSNDNKVLSLTPEVNKGGKGVGYSSGTRNVTGNKMGTFFMADYAGIDPDKGVEMIWEIDQIEYNATGKTIKTGRKIPATQANVTLNNYLFQDKTIIPSYFGGLNNSFKIYNFDVNLFFTFSGGNYIYNYNMKRDSYVHNGQTVLLADMVGNTWEPGKTDATYPYQSWGSKYPNAAWESTADDPNLEPGNKKGWWAATGAGDANYNLETQNHSKFLYKGDFIRLKNLSIGYSIPKKAISKLSLENLHISVQVSNLFTFTQYPGYDPEGATWVDAAGIPNTRTISFGISAKL
ncbi:MAG: TonB-dependent receptor [Paludibacter sp.]|nr:TonB-dependent receptor [Paludibacter sp.]